GILELFSFHGSVAKENFKKTKSLNHFRYMFFLLSSPCLLLVFSVSIRRGVIGSRQGAGREQTGSRWHVRNEPLVSERCADDAD
ncbi:hypothetical protein, partial [Bacteroides rodentium]|uniref:hypothetical protein n=1 Tax=Bacteroides rodentium TaxID=691816 RepID=UPI001ADF9958